MMSLGTTDKDLIPQGDVDMLSPIKAFVRTHSGLTFEGNGEEKLVKALAQRMHAIEADSYTQYHQVLKKDQEELDRFIALLTINETFFYREKMHLDLLCDELVPLLQGSSSAHTIFKIMSVGCSTGEEAYSITIALLERFGEKAKKMFKIVAGDIDKTALQKAQSALYGKFSFRGVEPSLIEKYFVAESCSVYRVKPEIREMVSFAPFNLLSEQNPACFLDVHVMFYRNVSIYFDEPTRKGILQRLKAKLCSNGYLIMGTTETLANDLGVLNLTSRGGCFFFTNSKVEKLSFDPDPLIAPIVMKEDEPEVPVFVETPLDFVFESAPITQERLDELITKENWQDALECLEELNSLSGKEKKLYQALISLYRRDYSDAQAFALEVLGEDEWSINAQVILGLIGKYQEDFKGACTYFKKAIYLENSFWLAHYFLGDCLRQLQQNRQAVRAYSQALELIKLEEGKADSSKGEIKLPYNLSREQVRFLCDLQIKTLKD